MPGINDIYSPPPELVLGTRLNARVPSADQQRQRAEVLEILRRFRSQPGVILADEVGMGKTFVALAIAYSVAVRSPRGPVIVMVPANLVDKWAQDLGTFCELYLDGRHPVPRNGSIREKLTDPAAVRYGVARHSVELMKLLDDAPRERCHLIFLANGAMARNQTDKWVRLFLIAECLRRKARGGAARLIQVKKQIHRFLGKLLWAVGEEKAHDWGEGLWQKLLQAPPEAWKDIFNQSAKSEHRLDDDPVPKAVIRAINRVELSPLVEALLKMPVRTSSDAHRVSERLAEARSALREIERDLWKKLLAEARWRSPLLVMDEAHHLKNPGTVLAKQLQSPDSEQDLRTGDGAMAKAFDRMLFLTATPFQLGHAELVNVLRRFGDVRWDPNELDEQQDFFNKIDELGKHLDESQRATIALQRSWSCLRPEDCAGDDGAWWDQIRTLPLESITSYQCAVRDAFDAAKRSRDTAQAAIKPWIVRHNKGIHWEGTNYIRRRRVDGAATAGLTQSDGLPIPSSQLLSFFLAARSAANPGHDLLSEALCSSYEAFRFTRENKDAGTDEDYETPEPIQDLTHSGWYLEEFDNALKNCSGESHPKIDSTVCKAVDLWEAGEKILVFAFYRHTCRALRIHIGREIDRRTMLAGQRQLQQAGREANREEVEQILERVQDRYFDKPESHGRKVLAAALDEIIQKRRNALETAGMPVEQIEDIKDVMHRFLRVRTTLARCFPIGEFDSIKPHDAVEKLLDYTDATGMSWRTKFDTFLRFLVESSDEERKLYIEALKITKTGDIYYEPDEDEKTNGNSKGILANVRAATGRTKRETRTRLVRAFNTPFFPDVLVCSEVMGEGVDLQRYCRHVIHHDLAWNPSTIEQRIGRIDRIGCKAEGRHPICVYIPFLAGAADERQYRVMTCREQWFRIVMGQDEVAQLISPDSANLVPLPKNISDELSFQLALG